MPKNVDKFRKKDPQSFKFVLFGTRQSFKFYIAGITYFDDGKYLLFQIIFMAKFDVTTFTVLYNFLCTFLGVFSSFWDILPFFERPFPLRCQRLPNAKLFSLQFEYIFLHIQLVPVSTNHCLGYFLSYVFFGLVNISYLRPKLTSPAWAYAF